MAEGGAIEPGATAPTVTAVDPASAVSSAAAAAPQSARFIDVDELPPGGEVMELIAADQVRLRAIYWADPAPVPVKNGVRPKPRGLVVLFQGRTEFIEKYAETISRFRALGYAVAAIDWRGQGRSDRALLDTMKGHVRDFSAFQLDVDALVAALAERAAPQPWILVGHSMGGAIAARALMRQDGGAPGDEGPRDASWTAAARFSKAILSAPMLGLYGAAAGGFSRWASWAMHGSGFGGGYTPGNKRMTMAQLGYTDNPLTSDPKRFAKYAELVRRTEGLAIGGPTWSWLRAAHREMPRLHASGTPTLIILGGDDEVVSETAARRYALEAPDCLVVKLRGARHEPFLETDAIQERMWKAIIAFLGRQPH